LPNGPLGYRERTLLALSPNDIDRLTIERDGKVFEVKSGPTPGRFEEWKMTKPAAGPADMQTVAQLAVMLANLRADQLITDAPQDSAQYGLDTPVLTCIWSTPQPGAPASKSAKAKASPPAEWTLTVGKPVSGKQGSHYARVSGNPLVFTLSPIAVQILNTELRDHRVIAFMQQQVDRIVFEWPGRKVGLSRKLTRIPDPGKPEWQPDEGSDAVGIAPERINDLLGAVSGLTAARFAQYDGKIPAETGLEPPLVTIEIHTVDRDVTHRLRLGKPAGENQRFATTASGDSGPVAVIAEAPWASWVTKPPPTGKGELPAEAIQKPKASP
jgi:hypothetical protein